MMGESVPYSLANLVKILCDSSEFVLMFVSCELLYVPEIFRGQ